MSAHISTSCKPDYQPIRKLIYLISESYSARTRNENKNKRQTKSEKKNDNKESY